MMQAEWNGKRLTDCTKTELDDLIASPLQCWDIHGEPTISFEADVDLTRGIAARLRREAS